VVSLFSNDRFGNAVPEGTAISFVANGASVVNPFTTDINGQASATLLSEQVIPPSGVVTVLAFTLGEESFLDNNGNGAFDPGDTLLTDDIPEPYVDVRPLRQLMQDVRLWRRVRCATTPLTWRHRSSCSWIPHH